MIFRTNFFQNFEHDLPLLFTVRIGRVNDVQNQIRLNNLFQCCLKSRNQLMRKFSNKSDSVGNQNWQILPKLNSPYQRVQSGE